VRERQDNGNHEECQARYLCRQYAINVCYELLSGHLMTAGYLQLFTYICE